MICMLFVEKAVDDSHAFFLEGSCFNKVKRLSPGGRFKQTKSEHRTLFPGAVNRE